MHKRFAVLFGFVPWMVFSELYASTTKEIIEASLAALATMVILDWHQLKKGFWLPLASAIYFILVALNGIFDFFPWAITHPAAVINLALAIIVWLSLIMKRPFTLQYAREEVEVAFWKSPLFIKTNYYLTLMWAIMMTVSALPSVFIPEKIYANSWFWGYVFNTACLGLAFFLNKKMQGWIIGWNFWSNVRKLPPVNSPYLEGGHKPVLDEVELYDLQVIGEIPTQLNGQYLRNGPNPYFTPYTYTYPIDGDGMIHRISIKDGKVSYKNAFVKTKGLQAELKAGKALYGGIALPIPPDPKYVQTDETGKSSASIHIVKWGNNLLALYETTPAYLLDNNLETIGEFQPDGRDSPFNVNAHHRVDPKTGQIYMFIYNTYGVPLTLYVFNQDYQLIKSVDIEKPQNTMIHDFLITENYIIIFDMPAIFNVTGNDGSEPFFAFYPDRSVTIILVKRSDYSISRIENISSFFVYHFVNAYEEDNKIIFDMVLHKKLNLNPALNENNIPPALYRGSIDLETLHYQHKCLCDSLIVEFPSYNLDYCAQKYQFAYLLAKKPDNAGGFNLLIKYDLVNNKFIYTDFGADTEIGEATFVTMRDSSNDEDDGYLVLFVYCKSSDYSDFVVLSAKNMQEIARVKLPRRVPHGLHGSWIATK